jgi:hypothetical protein
MNAWKPVVLYILVGALLLLGAWAVLSLPNPEPIPGLPTNVERFYDCNQVCYVWSDGSGDCYPCGDCK